MTIEDEKFTALYIANPTALCILIGEQGELMIVDRTWSTSEVLQQANAQRG